MLRKAHFLRRNRCMSLNLQSASGGPKEQPYHFLLALGEREEIVHVSVSEDCEANKVDAGPHDGMIVLRIFNFWVRRHIKEFSSRWIYCSFLSLLHNADVVPRKSILLSDDRCFVISFWFSSIYLIAIHFLKCAHNSLFSVHAVLSYQNTEPAAK